MEEVHIQDVDKEAQEQLQVLQEVPLLLHLRTVRSIVVSAWRTEGWTGPAAASSCSTAADSEHIQLGPWVADLALVLILGTVHHQVVHSYHPDILLVPVTKHKH